MNCESCKKPIDESRLYYWGRHSGEWHPACYGVMVGNGRWIIGAWHTPEGFKFNAGDEEYKRELPLGKMMTEMEQLQGL